MQLPGCAQQVVAATALLIIAACTDLQPTKTENPLAVPGDRKDIVSVCYSPADHSRVDIQTVALKLCGQDAVTVTPWRIDKYLNDCPILKKTRVSFLCVKGVR
tara:strand:- start:1924 stop:2232 length:309 start_codon:yes stop_codon:yes gene_type:complete